MLFSFLRFRINKINLYWVKLFKKYLHFYENCIINNRRLDHFYQFIAIVFHKLSDVSIEFGIDFWVSFNRDYLKTQHES